MTDDVRITWTKGKGPGGQHKNKVETCCVATHVPSGVSVRVDGRSRVMNERRARKLLKQRLADMVHDRLAAERKARRDAKIAASVRVRTYDFKKKRVTDHRTGKSASLKEILEDGNLDLLR